MSIPFMKLALILNIHVYMFAYWITKANIFTKGLKNIDSVEYKYFCPKDSSSKETSIINILFKNIYICLHTFGFS